MLGLLQAAMLAYVIYAGWYNSTHGFGQQSDGSFASGPFLGRPSLFWQEDGALCGQAVATAAALAASGRIRRLSYSPYAWICGANFCLLAISLVVLAPGTTYVHCRSGPTLVTRVRIDADWPVTLPAWFLFGNPVLVMLAGRSAIRWATGRPT